MGYSGEGGGKVNHQGLVVVVIVLVVLIRVDGRTENDGNVGGLLGDPRVCLRRFSECFVLIFARSCQGLVEVEAARSVDTPKHALDGFSDALQKAAFCCIR